MYQVLILWLNKVLNKGRPYI